MSDTIKLKIWIRTDKIGSECTDTIDFDREEWELMSDEKKEEVCRDIAFERMDWGFEEV